MHVTDTSYDDTILDWEIDAEGHSSACSLSKVNDLDAAISNIIDPTIPEYSDLSFDFLPDPSDSTSDVDEDEEQLICFESDDEDKEHHSNSLESSETDQGRIISRVEQFVVNFLEKLGGYKIELALVNRMKTGKNRWNEPRVLLWPKKTKRSTFKNIARLLCVVDLIHEALCTNIPTTKRDIFYKDVTLFNSQSVVNSLLDDLAATLEVPRSDLNVRASPKGLFCGSGVSVHLKEGGVLNGTDTEGTIIPARADISYIQVSKAVAWILIVEKEAAFQTLCRAHFTTEICLSGSGIIITGKGYPDLATREFVCHLSNTLPTSVPLLALVDADAYGLDILSVYKYGSQSLRHEGSKAIAERVTWLGLWASELSNLGLDKDHLIPLTKHDYKKAMEMLRRNDTIMPASWRKEVSHMLHIRRKAEIEIITFTSTHTLQPDSSCRSGPGYYEGEYVVQAKPPLVQYLIPKMKEWVCERSLM